MRQFCEFERLKWVMFQDESAPYPDDHFKLGRYLWPNIDVGLAMFAKIIKDNVLVLHSSTIKHLAKMNGKRKRAKMNVGHSWSHFTRGTVGDLASLAAEDTPQYASHVPRSGRDQNSNVEILLTRGEKMAKAQVH